ncbi:glutathione S-transferase family protein [Salinarimonas rosea]|uniref:glutathione S-transferase family protein n=1 Tax=Salinarimonas rosea TaxID=552063 RepID=UPI000400052D|nr:glutathione S-transferase family protein [Salinarimonas rosea]
MSGIVLVTFDRVPQGPRGYVRDLRIRWALEEAGLAYRIETTPFDPRTDSHASHQPFRQVPWLVDGDLTVFETGAMLLHLGERSEALVPRDAAGRSSVVQWLFAALNSVEPASLPWSLFRFAGDDAQTPGRRHIDAFLAGRLERLEPVLAARDWLAGPFSIADIAMVDVLRLVGRFDGLSAYPACRGYVARATARPAFVKAHADQMAHFAAADRARV